MPGERPLTRADLRELKYRRGQMMDRHHGGITYGFMVEHENHQAGFNIHEAFSSDTGLLKTYSSVAREITDIDQSKKRADQAGNLLTFTPHPDFPDDFFDARVLETSLSSIEQLPTTQGTKEIEQVINFWREVSGLAAVSYKTRRLQQVLNCLVTQPLTNPDVHFPLHPRLLKVRDKLLPTVEFSKQTLYNFSSPEFGIKILPCMNNLVMQTFIYAMENDGISLSSLQKLYLLRLDQTYQGKYALARPIAFRKYKNWLRSTNPVADKFYKNSSPDFYKWNPEADKKAQEILLGSLQIRDISASHLQEIHEENIDLAQKWKAYQREVYHLAHKRPIAIQSQNEDSIFHSLTITAEKPAFTHFILHLRGAAMFLTLDVDVKGRLFGLPPDLAKRFPHADKIIFNHLMTNIVPYLETTYPDVAEEIRRDKQLAQDQSTTPQTQPSRFKIATFQSPEKPRITKSKKRKANRTAFESSREKSTLSPELEDEMIQKDEVRVVNYTYDDVRKLAGKRTSEKDLFGVMRIIQRFETGQVEGTPLTLKELDISGTGVVELRTSGLWRAIVRKTNPNQYSLVDVYRHNSDKHQQSLKSKLQR